VPLSEKTIRGRACVLGLSLLLAGCMGLDRRESVPVELPYERPLEPVVTFLAVGDTGSGDAAQLAVARAMAEKAERSGADFVLLLGDNFYPRGVESVSDPLWRSAFEDVYLGESLQIPFHAVLGNHDHFGDIEAQIRYGQGSSRWRMPGRWYTHSHSIGSSGGSAPEVQFFALDTNPIHYERSPATDQLSWLAGELGHSSARWKIAVGHHPARAGGRHRGSRGVRESLEPLLAERGVDLYLSGHSHQMALMSARDGLRQVIAGSGSSSRHTLWWPDAVFASRELGFLWVRVAADWLVVEFVDVDGNTRHVFGVEKPER